MFSFGTTDHKAAAIRRVPAFSHLTDKEIAALASEMDEVSVEADTVLIHQGRPGDTFYVLLGGEVQVLIDGERRARLGPSSFFGEVSMMERLPATATVVATKPSTLLVMSREQFRDGVKGRSDLDHSVREVMDERIQSNRTAAAH